MQHLKSEAMSHLPHESWVICLMFTENTCQVPAGQKANMSDNRPVDYTWLSQPSPEPAHRLTFSSNTPDPADIPHLLQVYKQLEQIINLVWILRVSQINQSTPSVCSSWTRRVKIDPKLTHRSGFNLLAVTHQTFLRPCHYTQEQTADRMLIFDSVRFQQ